LIRNIIVSRDERPRTAHDTAAETTDHDQLPDRVRRLLDRRAAVHRRRAAYQNWCDANATLLAERQRWIDQHLSRSQEQSRDCGISYSSPTAGPARRVAHRDRTGLIRLCPFSLLKLRG
jgi:hypothetical protein